MGMQLKALATPVLSTDPNVEVLAHHKATKCSELK